MANTISRRGPGQRLELTTISGRILCGFGRWPFAAGQFGTAAAFIRLRACAYARDRSVPGLVRDIGVRRLRLCPGLGPRWDGQARESARLPALAALAGCS